MALNLQEAFPDSRLATDAVLLQNLQSVAAERADVLEQAFGNEADSRLHSFVAEVLEKNFVPEKLPEDHVVGVLENDLWHALIFSETPKYGPQLLAEYKTVYDKGHSENESTENRVKVRNDAVRGMLSKLSPDARERMEKSMRDDWMLRTREKMRDSLRVRILQATQAVPTTSMPTESDERGPRENRPLRRAVDEGQILSPIDADASKITGIEKRKK